MKGKEKRYRTKDGNKGEGKNLEKFISKETMLSSMVIIQAAKIHVCYAGNVINPHH